jgi:hypothetical protein
VFNVANAGNAPTNSTPIKRIYRQTDNWVSRGMWVVANQQAWNHLVGHETLDIAADSFTVAAEMLGLTVRPNRPASESFRINFGDDIPRDTRKAQWTSLRQAIYHPESRNFFYFGHGSPERIGRSANTDLMIPASEIAANLHTIPAGQTNQHGFRFVMLFGCETTGGILPEAFGVVHRENVDAAYYANAALTPAAFVGWSHEKAAGVLSSTVLDNAFYLQHFLLEWANGYGVKEALDRAKENYPDVPFINRSKLKVFGNWELRLTSFNR